MSRLQGFSHLESTHFSCWPNFSNVISHMRILQKHRLPNEKQLYCYVRFYFASPGVKATYIDLYCSINDSNNVIGGAVHITSRWWGERYVMIVVIAYHVQQRLVGQRIAGLF